MSEVETPRLTYALIVTSRETRMSNGELGSKDGRRYWIAFRPASDEGREIRLELVEAPPRPSTRHQLKVFDSPDAARLFSAQWTPTWLLPCDPKSWEIVSVEKFSDDGYPAYRILAPVDRIDLPDSGIVRRLALPHDHWPVLD